MLRLKEFRQKAGISQQELAYIVGLKASAVSNYEQGTREPNIETLAKIAIALDCSVDDLIDFKKIHDEISEEILEMIQKTKKA
jgi:transcriptional regulator with XRE-family HTH domain